MGCSSTGSTSVPKGYDVVGVALEEFWFNLRRAALEMYGNVMNQDLSEILQLFLHKFISGEALRLYHNEIHGVDDLNWKAFPAALIISDGIIRCGSVKQWSSPARRER